MKIPDLQEADIALLEKEIDRMNEVLPDEIIYSSRWSCYRFNTSCCQVCLPACRTLLCKNAKEEMKYLTLIIKYLNRFSDYLFVLARYAAHELNAVEIPWKPRV